MTHRGALSEKNWPAPIACMGELRHVGSGFWDDVSWEIFECTECQTRICTVGGYSHWWNFVSDRSEHSCSHEWAPTGRDSAFFGTEYYCTRCGDTKREPHDTERQHGAEVDDG